VIRRELRRPLTVLAEELDALGADWAIGGATALAVHAVVPRARTPDIRIDLLFPALGVESLGLMAARRAPIAGRDMPVVPLPHLVAAKLAVDPDEDRDRYLEDQQDLRALWARGLVDVGAVEQVLHDTGDRDAVRRLHELAGSRG
jgi:hypothetical protein